MAKYLMLKIKYDDGVQRIPATEVKKQYGRLKAYDGEMLVAEFPDDKVEYWSFSEGSKTPTA